MVMDWYGALYHMFELSGLNLLQSIGAFVTLVVKYSITKAPNVRDSMQDRDPIGHMALYL